MRPGAAATSATVFAPGRLPGCPSEPLFTSSRIPNRLCGDALAVIGIGILSEWESSSMPMSYLPRHQVSCGRGTIRGRGRSGQGRVSRTCRLRTTVRNCTRDEGGPFEVGSQVQASSHRELLSSRAMVVSVAETLGHLNRPGIGGDRFDQITQPWGVGP